MIGERVIYAGETPLASSIRVEQTGPLSLTVRAGTFTTTGQARVVARTEDNAAELAARVAAGAAEWLPGGERARVWLRDAAGAAIERARTYRLAADVVLTLPPEDGEPHWARVELGERAGEFTARLAVRRAEEPYAAPTAWRPVQVLVEEFAVPAGLSDLAALPLVALAVRPGFPLGTSAADWRVLVGDSLTPCPSPSGRGE